MRIIGTVNKWNDERGFGFITPNQIGDEIFVHISAFPGNGTRPTIGETISFEVAQIEGKTRAVKIQRPSGLLKQESRAVEQSSQEHKSTASLIHTLIALTLIAVIGYFGYTRFSNKSGSEIDALSPASVISIQDKLSAQPQFRCDGRQHCSQMSSYEEAEFFLAKCPNTKMDGDGDGEPCEDYFR